MPEWTVSRLAKRFGLSRSTLLYYDSIGLLSPLDRTASGYRIYSETMAERLRRICAYRETGMPLKEIAKALKRDAKEDSVRILLLKRLEEIGRELKALRARQRLVAAMLSNSSDQNGGALCDRTIFVETLRKAGLSEKDMAGFHAAFEKDAPAAHHDFLRLLGFSEEEIVALRSRLASPAPL